MSVITLDLAKNPELAALLADKEPGAKIDLHTSIRDLNEQTVGLTLEECSEGKSSEEGEDEEQPEGETKEVAAAPAEAPKKSYGKQYMEKAGVEE